MKALQLIIIGSFCLLSAHGQEYNPEMLTYGDWLRMEDTQPFQAEAFQSEESFQLRASSVYDLSEELELGGLTREVNIEDGIPVLLLLSLGYWFKCYRSLSKNKNKVNS